jgi:methylglutaconyl-CoA hydratase
VETLKIANESGVARVTLARPDVLNAFNETMIAEITETFTKLGADAGVRAVVLGSEGRAFCAGADLSWMQRAAANCESENLADAQRFAEMMRAIFECPKPTLARVQGAAYGGGVGLIAACDIAVAVDSAKFAVTEAKFGILPAVVAPYLINAVGPRHARRLALTAETIDAAEARHIGFVHEVVSAAQLDERLDAFLADTLRNGPGALGEIKALFRALAGAPINAETRSLTAATIARVRGKSEAKEGFAAFFDKRKADWIG